MPIDRLRHDNENEDEKQIARDGEVFRMPLLLADHAPLGFDDVDRAPQEVFDSYGNRPGNRPGPVYANKPAPIVDDRTAVNVAFDVRDALDGAAWRRPGAAPPVQTTDKEAAYEAYAADQSNAWQRRAS